MYDSVWCYVYQNVFYWRCSLENFDKMWPVVKVKLGWYLHSCNIYCLLDTTPPDIVINDKPHYISKQRQFTFILSCNENCSTFCSLYEEGSLPTYVICNLSNTMFSLKDNTTYVFLVKAVDAVGNEGNSTLYRFKTGIGLS